MATQGATTLTCDAYGQQTGDGAVQYTYDALGRMTQRGTTGSSQTMQYDGTGNLLAADGQYLYTRDRVGGLLGVRAATGDPSTARLVVTDQHTDVVATMTATDTTLTQIAGYDPLGTTIGPKTTLGNLGYQSEYTDTTSGKVNMAARWYNPATGQFTSRDTVQNNPSPNSVAANPFAYGNDDPLLNADPSGHSVYRDPQEYVPPAKKTTSHPRTKPKPKRSPARHMGRPEDRLDHGDPDGYVAYHNTTKKQIRRLRTARVAIERSLKKQHSGHMGRPEDRLDHGDPDGYVAYHNTTKKQIRALRDADNAIAASTGKNAHSGAGTDHGISVSLSHILDTLDAPGCCNTPNAHTWYKAQDQCQEDSNLDCTKENLWELAIVATVVIEVVPEAFLDVESGFQDTEQLIDTDEREVSGEWSKAQEAAARAAKAAAEKCKNSFEAHTRVLMSDGTAKPITSIRTGDKVAATNPSNDKVVGREVLALHDNVDTEMADVTVTDAKGHHAVIHTTQNHPFWDVTTSRWTLADHLHPGDHLKTATKSAARVTAVKDFTTTDHRYNLTVADLHTYYVLAGTAPVLVHNTDCGVLEGERDYDVYHPETGNRITDIDHVEGGVLWEEKSALYGDEGWISKQIDGKLNKYLEARKYMPGYENAPIGFRMTNPSIDPRFRSALESHIDGLRRANPGVDIRLEFAQ